MDDITRTRNFTSGVHREEIEEELNTTTAKLATAIAKGGWGLNSEKKPTSWLRGNQASSTKHKTLQGAALSERRVLGPYLPAGQGQAGEVDV
eukprot:2177915-Pyramimonas_sp.AAC.1